jgi:hypothetical protein
MTDHVDLSGGAPEAGLAVGLDVGWKLVRAGRQAAQVPVGQ